MEKVLIGEWIPNDRYITKKEIQVYSMRGVLTLKAGTECFYLCRYNKECALVKFVLPKNKEIIYEKIKIGYLDKADEDTIGHYVMLKLPVTIKTDSSPFLTYYNSIFRIDNYLYSDGKESVVLTLMKDENTPTDFIVVTEVSNINIFINKQKD